MSKRILAVFGFMLVLGSAQMHQAQAASEADCQQLVDKARYTLEDMRHAPGYHNARSLIRDAKAVLIVPSLIKVGIIFGGQGGDGVLLTRNGDEWSNPAFFSMGGGSVGLQIGGQEAKIVLIIRTQAALDALMQGNVKLGAQMGTTMANLETTQQQASSEPDLDRDIVVWSSVTGAYAGLTVDGSFVSPKNDENAAYYGRSLDTSEIVIDGHGENNGDQGLREALSRFADE
jgi:lipid-binding SYLF domain-containing protein